MTNVYDNVYDGGRRHTDAVEERSVSLLERHLTPEQLAQWRQTWSFTVRSQKGTAYRIIARYSHNIYREGDWGRSACMVLAPYKLIPIADHLLMQKLVIETDEARFEQVASRGYTPAPNVFHSEGCTCRAHGVVLAQAIRDCPCAECMARRAMERY